MTKWKVKLSGYEFDLKTLSSIFSEPVCCVAKDEGDEYYLTSDEFTTMIEVGDVYHAAQEWIVIVNACGRLHDANYVPVAHSQITRLNDNGSQTHFRFAVAKADITLSSRVQVDAVDLDPDGAPTPPPEPARAQRQLRLARQDQVVAEALKHWNGCRRGDADFWFSASKVYEIIRADMGGGDKGMGKKAIIGQQWMSGNEIERFGETANNPAISGDRARHGAGWATPAGITPYTEIEAEALIRKLLNGWLDWKDSHTP